MRLPAVGIAAAFAGGILLGVHPVVARNGASPLLSISFLAIAVLILTGILLVRIERLFPATVASLLSWAMLGFLGVCVAEQPRDAHHVISLVERGLLPLKTPLRWHGQLRDEPTRLPWGYGYEIELSGVEIEGALKPARGGLRLSFTTRPEEEPPPELHAGDEVAVLTEAKRPQVFRDEGAFDRRAYLAQQNIDLVATLRAPELIERIGTPTPTIGTLLARARRRLREEIDELFAGKPQVAGVLRAMLLGDRSFVDRAEAADFQKTGVFHVLVVAGLHVGALAFALYWVGRKLRLSRVWTTLFTLTMLGVYVAVVEQRAPVLRAAVMAAMVVHGGFFFRRLELLNSAALAALILLVAKPLALRDSSFQLTFVAIGCIAGLAFPWLEKTVQPYERALRGWRDVTRDAAHEPRAIQFRIDLRSLAQWISGRLPLRLGKPAGDVVIGGLSLTFRVWELLVLTVALQTGMGRHRPARFPNVGVRFDFCNSCQASRGSALLAHCPAFARCAVVRAFSRLELPDSRAAVLVDYVVLCCRDSACHRNAAEASAEENHALGIEHDIYCVRSDDCNLSLSREVDQGQIGTDSSGCRPGRFAARGFSWRENYVDRWRRSVRRISWT